ncbi:hypothetical protein [Chimaeribacter californicus]|uniref:hypothetical protein n=1 Tax=Chimaeribacter californicus TaxID=2060067 RepID=UPI0011AFACA9|nr:hypothetical protein [Chimaeribacter californicus]
MRAYANATSLDLNQNAAYANATSLDLNQNAAYANATNLDLNQNAAYANATTPDPSKKAQASQRNPQALPDSGWKTSRGYSGNFTRA